MNKTIIMFTLIAIIFLIAGIGAGILISGNLINKQHSPDISQNIKPEPKVQPELPKITMPEILYNLTGLIQEIEEDFIVIEVNIPYVDETNQIAHKTEIRKAMITVETNFSNMEFINTKEPNRKTIQESEITLQDLKIGDQIEVISNKDIKDKREFEAVRIRILP